MSTSSSVGFIDKHSHALQCKSAAWSAHPQHRPILCNVTNHSCSSSLLSFVVLCFASSVILYTSFFSDTSEAELFPLLFSFAIRLSSPRLSEALSLPLCWTLLLCFFVAFVLPFCCDCLVCAEIAFSISPSRSCRSSFGRNFWMSLFASDDEGEEDGDFPSNPSIPALESRLPDHSDGCTRCFGR